MAYHIVQFIRDYYPQYYSLHSYPAADCICIRGTKEEWGILGNFGEADLVVKGTTFCNSEQLYQMMGFTEVEPLKEIHSSRGMTIKMKSKKWRNNGHLRPDWGMMIVDAMKFCLMTKYEQCEDFRVELERTKGKTIVEDQTSFSKKTADTWGVKLVGDNYEGSNLLGRLLMELRDNGHLEYNLPADSLDFIERLKTGNTEDDETTNPV